MSTEPDVEIHPALEADFNLRARHPERTAVYADFEARSRDFHDRWPWYETLWYASPPRCRIDLYLPGASVDAGHGGVFVFIHGGYWRALDAEGFRFVAEPHVRQGAAVALVEYPLAPRATLTEIVAHTRAALRALAQRLPGLAGTDAPTVVSGHSAGAHLAALSVGEVKGPRLLLGISGLYDLAPLQHTNVQRDVRFTDDEVRQLSPVSQPIDPAVEALLVVGERETPGFHEQTALYARALRQGGADAQTWIAPRRTHFDVLEELVDPDSPLFGRIARGLRR